MTSALLAGCTPQAAVLMSVLPGDTLAVLVGNLQQVDDANRRQIAEFERRGDWRGMADFSEAGIARSPAIAEWQLVAGYAYSRLGEHARAAICYAAAVKLAPDEILGWNLLAQAYRDAGEPARAMQTIERALLVTRDSPATFYLLGETYRDLRRWQHAIASYEEALKLEPRFGEAWVGLGRAYARLGRMREAGEVVRQLQQLNPQLAAGLAREIGQP